MLLFLSVNTREELPLLPKCLSWRDNRSPEVSNKSDARESCDFCLQPLVWFPPELKLKKETVVVTSKWHQNQNSASNTQMQKLKMTSGWDPATQLHLCLTNISAADSDIHPSLVFLHLSVCVSVWLSGLAKLALSASHRNDPCHQRVGSSRADAGGAKLDVAGVRCPQPQQWDSEREREWEGSPPVCDAGWQARRGDGTKSTLNSS